MKLTVVLILTIYGVTGYNEGTVPPIIIDESPRELPFKEFEAVVIKCNASGSPSPTYHWYKDGQLYNISGADGRVTVLPGSGSLRFQYGKASDEGVYQCSAQNPYGTSLTDKTLLKAAYLANFKPSRYNQSNPWIFRPYLGEALTLMCIPPESYPKPNVYWAILLPDGRIEPVELSHRKFTYNKNLHFANIIAEDAKHGSRYACIVENMVLKSMVMGYYGIISPQGERPVLSETWWLWYSPKHQVVMRGNIWKSKCIFSGYPTPTIEWRRMDNAMPASARFINENIIIENVQFDDQGRYECIGTNNETMTPVKKSVNLIVEEMPSWTRKPESIDVPVYSDAVFYCEADALPEVTVYWLLNGVPIKDVPPNPRLTVEKNKLTFKFLRKEDTQVIQCNATNKHGYVFQNAYLNVFESPLPGPFNSSSKQTFSSFLLWITIAIIFMSFTSSVFN